MKDIKSHMILNNGVKMPWLGFGTYGLKMKLSLLKQ